MYLELLSIIVEAHVVRCVQVVMRGVSDVWVVSELVYVVGLLVVHLVVVVTTVVVCLVSVIWPLRLMESLLLLLCICRECLWLRLGCIQLWLLKKLIETEL